MFSMRWQLIAFKSFYPTDLVNLFCTVFCCFSMCVFGIYHTHTHTHMAYMEKYICMYGWALVWSEFITCL